VLARHHNGDVHPCRNAVAAAMSVHRRSMPI
jgi:hypothetical protein